MEQISNYRLISEKEAKSIMNLKPPSCPICNQSERTRIFINEIIDECIENLDNYFGIFGALRDIKKF